MAIESNTTTERLIYCSFCGSNQYQITLMFETTGAAICNVCVETCHNLWVEKVAKHNAA